VTTAEEESREDLVDSTASGGGEAFFLFEASFDFLFFKGA